ncbi:hypothetical protein [Paenibacillus sp. SYP-B3998]|nr:hypothetical protein [Paenibacillus sp. SYP-B3998]
MTKQLSFIKETYSIKEEIGLPIGSELPVLSVNTITNTTYELSFNVKTLLLFASTNCHVCFEFYPHLTTFHKKNPLLNIELLMLGDIEEVNNIIKKYELGMPVYQISHIILEQNSINKLPFGQIISEKGIILRKQLVRTEEELMNLVS